MSTAIETKTNETELKVLIVDDSEDDVFLLVRELRKGGIKPNYIRVDTGPKLAAALEQEWDLVISDHNMPGFSSEETLEMVKEKERDLPVIIVSGTIGEDAAVKAMRAGASDYVMKDNLKRLIPAIHRELKEVTVKNAHKKAEQTIRHMSFHDSLTDLVNRKEFDSRLKQALSSSKEHGYEHMLLYLDLDQFKLVNDTCGHVAGDELLKQVSSILAGMVRDTDTLARLGGDEFGILLERCTEDCAVDLAERLKNRIAGFKFVWQDKPFMTGISIGIVSINQEVNSASEILSKADIACYAAKDKGRNTIQVYQKQDSDLKRRHSEMQWTTRLHQAIDEDRFFLCHQDMMSLKGDSGYHTEFLVRLKEGCNVILPGAFIPAAERYNLMPIIDLIVVEKVFEYLLVTGRGFSDEGTYFINLSGNSLSDKNFFPQIKALIKNYPINPSRICFEITETAAIAQLSETVGFIREIRQEGCKFALDDFGCGMSSFSYLKTIPVDYLKIDGGFVRNLLNDPIDQGIVKACNQIGHAANLKTIAEFVENDSILDLIRKFGVDYVQGYAIAKPKVLNHINYEVGEQN